MDTQLKSTLYRFYIFEFLSGLHFLSAVLVPFFTEWGNVSLTVALALQSWFTFSIFLMEIPTGTIADKYGRKFSVALGCFTVTLGALIYGIYPNLILFILAEFIFAVGIALISGADKALVYDTLKEHGLEEEATTIWGKARSYHLAGILIGAPLGSLIAARFGLNIPMLLTTVPSIFAGLVILTIKEPKRAIINKEIGPATLIKEGFLALRKHPVLGRWTINSTLVAAASYFVIWLYQPLMMSLGIDIKWFGLVHAYLVIVQIVISYGFGYLAKILGSKNRYYLISALLVSAGMLLVARNPSIITLFIMLSLSGGFGLTRSEFMDTDVNKYIESDKRATVLSSISMYRKVSLAILNPFVGLTTQRSIYLSLTLVGLIPLLTLFFPLNGEEKP